ncbi:hypothetical protein [Sphingopyxis sp. JAI128]|uniref:hypothetical protein n=1 Tax=Sphingopyxis sp. JAI128 TaxID=2723066 RepID=UPI001614FA49|nr:hypothetical protein [Sphingopyxis sp. JAI128]MBB6426690.1 hypothetical protein [Sphingopyxis sp. JAI128]
MASFLKDVTMGEVRKQPLFGFPRVRNQSRKRAPLTFVAAVLRICCTFARVDYAFLRQSRDSGNPVTTVRYGAAASAFIWAGLPLSRDWRGGF